TGRWLRPGGDDRSRLAVGPVVTGLGRGAGGGPVVQSEGPVTVSEAAVESYRGELIVYCYRFFASVDEAEDAVQETFVRAWRNSGSFEGRASLRRWLYAIATNVCLDMAKARQRRCLPMDMNAPGPVPANGQDLPTAEETTWVTP